ncbi:MAG: ribulose-phosphate 3-epimerase [Phycisphaeraceae bacterium]|nr:ribulose-phosphate 3-epimerase [Phycisphaeraceae bacterium]MCW5754062.1 ribulose-phosphate 3-epimerase [Phycisphaeraceae bacterium]
MNHSRTYTRRDMTNVLSTTARRTLIAPSILSADFGHMAEECRSALDAGADLLHLDVMDGHFVPNLTMGPDMCRGLRRAFPKVTLDVHLMVMHPQNYFEAFVKAGADHLTIHIEAMPPADAADQALELAEDIRELGATAGLAINPPTPVERFLGLVEHFDLILIMSVNPGFSGQAFIPEVLDKARRIRPLLRHDQRLQIDGGVSPANAPTIRAAGVDVLVAASAIFGLPPARRSEAIALLRG